MTYKDPETGEVFEDIKRALRDFCNGYSLEQCFAHGCPFDSKASGNGGCIKWAEKNPIEAARLMGYEVIDEKEDNMDKQDKPFMEREGLGPSPTRETEAPGVDVGAGSKPARPRLAEVLGVEVGERFAIKGLTRDRPIYFVDENGFLRWYEICMDNINALALAINHPERIIRTPRLTEPETAIMRAVGAIWVSRNDELSVAVLWESKPHLTEDGYEGANVAAEVFGKRFPSVKPGDCIELEGAEG